MYLGRTTPISSQRHIGFTASRIIASDSALRRVTIRDLPRNGRSVIRASRSSPRVLPPGFSRMSTISPAAPRSFAAAIA